MCSTPYSPILKDGEIRLNERQNLPYLPGVTGTNSSDGMGEVLGISGDEFLITRLKL
jgi:hypothetical protein